MKIPDAVLSQHMAVLGKTRSGKSSVLRSFVERLLDSGERVCVLDPKGDWWGLKSSANGKTAGYPVVIFGGQRADIPLNQHAGTSVAELVATGNRPCVIDLGGWMVGERTRFFIDFASTLFRSQPGRLFLVIDEVHNFAPQGKILDPDAGKMLHWANRLASEGAGKGLVILSASQRPQKVHKDFLTCAETLVAMRVIHKLDRDAIKDWIDGAGDAAKGTEVLKTLATMARGEGWIWSPEAEFGPLRMQFPLFKTYDSFKAPEPGQSDKPLKGWAEVDLDEVKAKLAAVVEEAKANDPKILKQRIGELERQLKAKPSAAPDQASIDRAVSTAVADLDRHWQAELKRVETALTDRTNRLGKIEQLAHLNGDAAVVVNWPAAVAKLPATFGQLKVAAPSRGPTPVPAAAADGDFTITKTQQRVLDAVAWYESLGEFKPSLIKIGAVAKIDTSGGYFSNVAGPLSSAGLIVREPGCLSLTEAGRVKAKQPQVATSLAEYHEELRKRIRRMKSAAARTIDILNVIIRANGAAISCEQIGEQLSVDHTGGYFSNLIGPLSTAGLIERSKGVVTPTKVLFPDGLL